MMVISKAAEIDAEQLAALKLRLFRETFLVEFAIPYPARDLVIFEHECYGVEKVNAELADPSHMTWIARRDGEMVAYVHCGPCKLPHPEVGEDSGELYQIYLDRSVRGAGLGGRLLGEALDWLAHFYPGPQWLGVWSGNHRAQAVYRKYGFRKVGDYQFAVGDWRDEEFILRRGGA